MYTKYSEKVSIGKVSQYENKWYPPFLKQIPCYFTNPFLFVGEIWTPPFWVDFKKNKPLFIKGVSNYA